MPTSPAASLHDEANRAPPGIPSTATGSQTTWGSSQDYRGDIDGLRAIAVLVVVLHHAEVPGFDGGYVGVDMFFVISGYLISRIIFREIDEGRFSFLQFYERRARRILPALFAVVAAVLSFGALLYMPAAFEDLSWSTIATLAFVSNLYFWRTTNDYFAASPQETPLLHTWSLGVEEQFYILFPILALVATALFRKRRRLAVVCASIGSFVVAAVAVETTPSFAFYMLPSRFWELGLGSIAALGIPKLNLHPGARTLVASCAASSMVAPVFLYTPEMPFPGVAALPVCLGTVVLIALGETRQTVIHKAIGNPVSLHLGRASYSIYLWHWPLLCGVTVLSLSDKTPPFHLAVSAVAAAIGMGFLSLHFVERPFRDRRLVGSRTVWFAASAGIVCLLPMAFAATLTGGAPQRFEPELWALLESGAQVKLASCEPPSVGLSYDRCAIGDTTASRSFVVLGDSHAMTFGPAIDIAATRSELRGDVFHAGGCPPLLPAEKVTPCGRHREFVLDEVLRDGEVRTVILAGYWMSYFDTSRRNYLGNHKQVVGFDVTDFQLLYLKTVRRLMQAGKRVVVLEDVAELPYLLSTAVMLSERYGMSAPPPVTLELYRSQNARANDMLRLAEEIGADVIRVGEFLCSPECRVRNREALFYADRHHLTTIGSTTLLADFFKRTLFDGMNQQLDAARAPF